MAEEGPPPLPPSSKSAPDLKGITHLSANPTPGDSTHAGSAFLGDGRNPSVSSLSSDMPSLSRTTSYSNSAYNDGCSDADEPSFFPPMERITMFDFIENLALPQKIQNSLQTQADKFKRQQSFLKSTGLSTRDRMVEEWRRRVPTPEEQLDKYRKRMRQSVERLSERWNEKTAVTAREKASFIGGVMNIFISGYLIGAFPQYFPIWYTAQLLYFLPIRYYTYHKIGYHYFLADLCYFVNLLLLLSIWVFPNSKRLFISSYCLAMGNNAIAIAMWRNSLVFHSMDKITSLFIHIMPCVTLHCLVHLLSPEYQKQRYPAIHTIRFSQPGSREHYGLGSMMIWATVPYAVWQLSYHFLITVRRRDKIAAGRPTSFTWLRKSYAKTWIGKIVLSLPNALQEPAFMLVQYAYSSLTMIPCPVWFWYRWASALFLLAVFTWSVYNGATYYIDYYGTKFQKELEALKKEVGKWQKTPDGMPAQHGDTGAPHNADVEKIPPLEGSTGAILKSSAEGEARERK
ncbi:hypothetical protein M011DRAFT_393227 [Sporormia fimetaria CBS 119925]|uniref:Glycerophosphocholine acyltransferase 1 n=1 Tax=Sporormia fimetaria CBS 119925 TaxID=1340428 RepID=A0A6A6VQ85_9PLEO|nr:hypothetical protein M011DRAFT_393227 [Sporormia fimetaria CBS 119925]